MPAITIRQLPDHVHAALKQQAASHNRSVEAHVRAILAAYAEPAVPNPLPPSGAPHMPEAPKGFAEASVPWGNLTPASPLPDLWGALKGTVHVNPATNLTEPLDEPWEATTL